MTALIFDENLENLELLEVYLIMHGIISTFKCLYTCREPQNDRTGWTF